VDRAPQVREGWHGAEGGGGKAAALKNVPAWALIGGAAVLAVILLRGRRSAPVAGSSGTGQPVAPATPGTPDKTAQNPKAVPYRGY